MNTPRELILARHRAVEPRLDAIRRRQVAAWRRTAADGGSSTSAATARRGSGFGAPAFFRRPLGVGLAAAWLLILALRLPLYLAPAPLFASSSQPLPKLQSLPPAWRADLAARQRLRAELLGRNAPSARRRPAPRPGSVRPRDRSALRDFTRFHLA